MECTLRGQFRCASAPTLASQALRSVGDSTINDYEAYGLFRLVMGRFYVIDVRLYMA